VNWTSFDVVNKARRILDVKKVGHAGSLDPFATGVLLLCTGRATKWVPQFMELEKEYVGEIELGTTTDTLDVTGRVLTRREVPEYSLDEIHKVCQDFVGEILQVPPAYSALKVQGQRLYKRAREGRAIEVAPRRVKIHRLEVLSYSRPVTTVRVICSKGTYIRALARDIGQALGCGAFLRSLTRTRIGDFRIENALEISELESLRVQTGEAKRPR